MSKRFYWLKLSEDFFHQPEIKRLRQIAGGDTYTIIYQKLLLLSLKNDGKLYYSGYDDDFVSEMALEIDEKYDDVAVTVQFLIKRGILLQQSDYEYEVLTAAEMTGKECDSARRMRTHRQRQLSQSDVTVSQSDTEKKREEKELEADIRNKRGRVEKTAAEPLSPPTLGAVKEYIISKGYSTDPDRFYAYYAAKGWRGIHNWQSQIDFWQTSDKEKSNSCNTVKTKYNGRSILDDPPRAKKPEEYTRSDFCDFLLEEGDAGE